MNFFQHFYPSLLKVPGFLLEFITPIVKATKGTRVRAFECDFFLLLLLSFSISGLSRSTLKKSKLFLHLKKKQEFSFYTLPEYEAWRDERGGAPGWKAKYYKGEFFFCSLLFSFFFFFFF